MQLSKIVIIVIAALGCLSVTNLQAQNRTASAYYYDKAEGGNHFSKYKNIFKTDIYSIVEGDAPIIYERRTSDILAFEVGLGLLLPYSSSFLPAVVAADRNRNFEVGRTGLSFMIAPRFYNPLEPNSYWSLMLRLRGYEKLLVSELAFGKGYLLPISQRFMAEGTVYASLLWQNLRTDDAQYRFLNGPMWNSGNGMVFSLTFAMKLGFAAR